MCPIKSVSSTSSRKLPRRCCTPWPQPARNSATAFPSSRAADPARPSEPSPARPGHPATTAGEQVVRTSIPVRSTSADRGSEDNLAADHARVGTLAPLAADHGGGLPIVRPPLPDGDGAGSTGSATGTREPVQAAGPGSGQAFQPQLGEGADVPG